VTDASDAAGGSAIPPSAMLQHMSIMLPRRPPDDRVPPRPRYGGRGPIEGECQRPGSSSRRPTNVLSTHKPPAPRQAATVNIHMVTSLSLPATLTNGIDAIQANDYSNDLQWLSTTLRLCSTHSTSLIISTLHPICIQYVLDIDLRA